MPTASCVPGRARDRLGHGSDPAGGLTMLFVERYLLPPGRTDAERAILMRNWQRKRRGIRGHVVAVSPGEPGWVRQTGNQEGVLYFAVVERRGAASLPRLPRWRAFW